MSSPTDRHVLYVYNMYVTHGHCSYFSLAGSQPLHGTGFEHQYYTEQGWGRIGCRVVCMPPHEMHVIVVFYYASLDIVFILLKEHYLELGIHPLTGCIEMMPASGSLQTV